MSLRKVALTLVGFFALLAAGVPPLRAQDLAAAIQRQVAARESLRTQAEEGQSALRTWYDSALDAVRRDAANKADLDRVLAADAERARMDRDLTPEEMAALPKLMRDLRLKYDQARLQRMTQHKAALLASLREYMIALDALQKSLTRKLDVDGAVAARKERTAAAEEVTALSAPGAVVALTPAAPAATPAASPARSGPYVRPTLPGPVKVAAAVRANGTVQAPAEGAIPFEMPRVPPNVGIPAGGGRGILLKNDPAAGRNGTTWSLSWTFHSPPNYGLTFIHPCGAGHIMVRLRSSRFEPVTRNGWETHPMLAGGSPTFFELPEGVPDPFPLTPQRKYAIVSHLDAKGRYTLSIDGQVVRTGEDGSPETPHVSHGFSKLTLPEGYQGEGLPMQWEAGYAGLLVWPAREDSLNLCEDITFQAGAPALAQASPAPLAVAPPPVAAPPAPAAPRAAVIPPITPPAAVAPVAPPRAASAPLRATSLAPGGVNSAPIVQVASELKAHGTIQTPVQDAIPFETPPGLGHTKGGRGVLIKNDASVGGRGSTWTAEWTPYYATWIMFVHPLKNGHAVVRVGTHGAEPVYLSGFQRNPMSSGGSPTVFKETPAGTDIYPLKPNQKYLIVSQFDSKGRYTLTIDGKPVQAGGFSTPSELSTYTSTSPMILPEGFKGEGLPTKWKEGYAAMIVGPVYENAPNRCESISFQGSAPPAEKTVR